MSERKEARIDEILKQGVDRKASDIHILTKLQPHFRISGSLVPMDCPVLEPQQCRDLLYEILSEKQIATYEAERELDFSYGVDGYGRFRINYHSQRGSIGAAIRPLRDKMPTFEELGLNVPVVTRLLDEPHGLILVCGPTGSGKSTTLASMIDYLNQNEAIHIITLEDPIEFLFKHKKAIVEQREIGMDTATFREALRRILRQDPDVVLVGEMRDLETITAALRIAETGHLVLATLHTGEVVQAMGRIVNSFPGDEQPNIRTQLSLILQGVFIQQLLPKQDGSGRCLATEVMVATPAIRNLIREGQFQHIYSHIQMGGNFGMHTMNASLMQLYRKNVITKELAFTMSNNPKELENMLRMGK